MNAPGRVLLRTGLKSMGGGGNMSSQVFKVGSLQKKKILGGRGGGETKKGREGKEC